MQQPDALFLKGAEAKPRAEQPQPAESSFKSSMERAEQKAAKATEGAGKPKEEAQDSPEAEVKEAVEQLEQEAAVSLEQPEDAGQEDATEGILELLQGVLGKAEQAEEPELPEEEPVNELQAGLVAAVVTLQQGQEQPVPEGIGQEAQQEAAQVQAVKVNWQGNVPQEGEGQDFARGEAAMEFIQTESTVPGEQRTEAQQFEAVLAAGENSNSTNTGATAAAARRQQAAELPDQPAPQAAQQPRAEASINLAAPSGEMLPTEEARELLSQSLAEQVQTAVSTGKEELYVQLRPESLGGLVIHLTMTEEGIRAQVRTTSENIQHLVNSELAQLEAAMKERDIPVVQMEVIFDQAANNNFLGQQRQAWQQGGSGSGSGTGGVYQLEEPVGLYENALAMAAPDEALAESVVYSA